MSGLASVLDAHEEEIARAYVEELSRANCPRLLRTHAGDGRAMFRALRACCRQEGEAPARAWTAALRKERGSAGVPYADVLTALRGLERVVRDQIAKVVYEKPVMLAALAELSEAVDLLRRCSIDGLIGEGPGDPQPTSDFVDLAETIHVFICMASLHGRPFYVNPAGRRLLGLDVERSALAASLHDYYSEQSWRELRDVAVPVVKEQGRWEGKSQLRNLKTGNLVDVLTTMLLVRRMHGHRPSYLAIIHSDASERIRLEEALAEANARKHAILESALDPIITIDHRGVITEFNRAAEQTFRRSRKEVLGTQPSEVLFPASMSVGQQHRIDRYLDAGEGSLLGRRIEVAAVRSNGQTFPAEMAMTISQEQGAPVLSFFVRDISDRKKAERDQARYAAELERSNRELEQFAYVASHDLQEPLRKIRTFGDRLEMKCGRLLDAPGRECVRRMQSAAGRMQLLIEGLLTLSRVTTKGKDFERVDLATVAREVVADLEVQIEQVGGRIELGNLPAIQADGVQMRQLLQNLIGNALKFRRPGERPVVSVHGRFLEGRGRRPARGSAAEEKCRIVVEDNGIGFEERHMERVFGIFQRLHPRDVYEGTGIGLPICRKIVERHGGTITARSTPGKGSTFEVVLPVRQPNKETSNTSAV